VILPKKPKNLFSDVELPSLLRVDELVTNLAEVFEFGTIWAVEDGTSGDLPQAASVTNSPL